MRPLLVLLAYVCLGLPALADDAAAGRALAEVNCGRCHALGATGDSPFKDAPPFRIVRESYSEAELEDAFNEGVAVTHPAMPEWSMTPDQARQLAAFIMRSGQEAP